MQVFTVCDYKGLCLRSVSSSHVLRSAEGTQHPVGSAKGGTRSEPYNNAFSSSPGKQFEKHKTLENNGNSKSPLYDQSLTHSSVINSMIYNHVNVKLYHETKFPFTSHLLFILSTKK